MWRTEALFKAIAMEKEADYDDKEEALLRAVNEVDTECGRESRFEGARP